MMLFLRSILRRYVWPASEPRLLLLSQDSVSATCETELQLFIVFQVFLQAQALRLELLKKIPREGSHFGCETGPRWWGPRRF